MTGRPGDELPVGALAELYLGNILYALERAALSLDDDGKHEDAAFYRGIARELSLAHGRQQERGADGGSATRSPESSRP